MSVTVTLTNKEPVHQIMQATFGLKSRDGYTVNLIITRYPTGNCQLSSIGYLNCLFLRSWTKEVMVGAIKECYRLIGMEPKLIFVDVQKKHIEDVEKLFTVKTKSPYISTNSSEMCAFIVSL